MNEFEENEFARSDGIDFETDLPPVTDEEFDNAVRELCGDSPLSETEIKPPAEKVKPKKTKAAETCAKPQKTEKPKNVKKVVKPEKNRETFELDCGFKLAAHEEIIKSYRATKTGILTVTDRRVLYNDCGTLRKEASLDSVTSIESNYSMHFGAWFFSFALLCIAAGIVLFVVDFTKYIAAAPVFVKYIFWGVGGALGLTGLVLLCFVLKLQFFIAINCFAGKNFLSIDAGNASKTETVVGRPGRDSRAMMNEIGAIIIEAREYRRQ